jgi:hypothetical protein
MKSNWRNRTEDRMLGQLASWWASDVKERRRINEAAETRADDSKEKKNESDDDGKGEK